MTTYDYNDWPANLVKVDDQQLQSFRFKYAMHKMEDDALVEDYNNNLAANGYSSKSHMQILSRRLENTTQLLHELIWELDRRDRGIM